ncbi:MAG: PaaI family thioesterase [Actinomycetota bacterium]
MDEIWKEPVRGGYPDLRLFGLPGIELLRRNLERLNPIPPIAHLTGLWIDSVSEREVVFSMPAADWFLSSQEHISVGALTMLADAALGSAVQIRLPPATPYTTAELSMTFFAPCPPDGRLRAIGRPIRDGRPLCLSEVWVEDGRGNPVAHGTSSCFVLPAVEGLDPTGVPPAEHPTYDTPDPCEREAPGSIIEWDEWRKLSGEEILQRQIAGELPQPPIHYLTGMTLQKAARGAVSFSMPAHEWLSNPMHVVEGGATAMFAHAALATAVTSTLEAGEAYTPVDVKVNFLRPLPTDGREVVAEGVVTHRGRTLAVASAEVIGADGKKIALATGSTRILGERASADSEP